MTTTLPVPVANQVQFSRPVRYMFWGAGVGLLAAIAATFLMALFDGQAQGMTPGSCVLYSCVLTLMLSQMAGLTGMLVGAVAGALAGGAVGVVHDRLHASSR
jgi:hypothetical protein